MASLVILAIASPVVRADVDPHRELALDNASFEGDLSGWIVGSTSPQASVLHDPSGAARLSVPAGASAWLFTDLVVGTGGLEVPELDRALCQQLDLRLQGTRLAGAPTLDVRLTALTPRGEVVLSEGGSTPLTGRAGASQAFVRRARTGLEGRVPPLASHLRIRLEVEGPGVVLLEEVWCGEAVQPHWVHGNGGFEVGGRRWTTAGASVVSPGHRGVQSLELAPSGTASTRIPLGPEPGQPCSGQIPSMGLWLMIPSTLGLGDAPLPGLELALEMEAVSLSGQRSSLGQLRVLPTRAWAKRWTWVEFEADQPIPQDTRELALEVVSALPGPVQLDDLELGVGSAVDGVLPSLELAAWVPWYRSPASPLATGIAASPRERWRNWAWVQPPPCAPLDAGFVRDPDNLRSNGRRDGAAGTTDGLDGLPLVGLYDSRDPDVAALQVDLARAAGLDGFVVDWHSGLLDQQQALPGEGLHEQRALDVLWDAAERPGLDFALAPMLEPKVFQAGWVRPGSTPLERRALVADDLQSLVERYAHRRAWLREHGELVVFVFWHDLPGWDGASLTTADWTLLETEVEQRTGEALRLVATHPPAGNGGPFQGLARWHLFEDSLARFASFADFQAGQVQAPVAGAVEALARKVTGESRAFAAPAAARRPWRTAWWGFDDSGVAGWGGQYGLGSDGQPQCVRVSAEVSPAALGQTLSLPHAFQRTLVISWNDWNERTALEPAWDEEYHSQLLGGMTVDPAARARSVGGLLELAGHLGGTPDRIDGLLASYFQRVAQGAAVAYD